LAINLKESILLDEDENDSYLLT